LRCDTAALVERAFGLTGPVLLALFAAWGLAISPWGDVPKYRVRFSTRTRHVCRWLIAPVERARLIRRSSRLAPTDVPIVHLAASRCSGRRWNVARSVAVCCNNHSADCTARFSIAQPRWRAEFAAMGKAEGGRSGWVIFAYSPRYKRLVNQWAADHTTLTGGRPISIWKPFVGTTPSNSTSSMAERRRRGDAYERTKAPVIL
jgi:hypothetical protein